MAFYGLLWPFYIPFMEKHRFDWNCTVFSRGHRCKTFGLFLKKNTSETREAETLNHVSSLRHLATPLLLPSEVNDSSTKLVLFNYYMLSSWRWNHSVGKKCHLFFQSGLFFLQESIFLWKKDSLFTKRHRLTNKSKCRPPQNGGNVEMDHWTSYHHSEFRTARLLDSLSLRNMLHGQGRAFECWFFLIFQKQWENFTSPMTFVRLHLKMATTSFLKRIDGTRQKEMKLDLPLFYVWGFFIWLRIDNATV